MKNYLYIILLLLLAGCGISEDCFKGGSSKVTKTFDFRDFSKVKVYSGVGLIIEEGEDYEVKITTNEKIQESIEIKMEGDMLVVKDNSSCNLVRDYGETKLIVTIPNGVSHPLIQELEIHSKSEQMIKSEGLLHSPVVRLFSIGEDGDGSGSSDFYISIDTNGQFVVESNTISNFYIEGQCREMLLNFYFGDGRFQGENFEVDNIKIFQRGSNDMIVKPLQRIEGKILSTGDVYLKTTPNEVEVEELFSGSLIYN